MNDSINNIDHEQYDKFKDVNIQRTKDKSKK